MTGSSQTPKDEENKDETPEIEESEGTFQESASSSADSESSIGEDTEEMSSETSDDIGDVSEEASSDTDEGETSDNAAVDSEPIPGVVPAATPAAPVVAPPAVPAPSAASSTFALVAGGLIAGALGFLIATYAVPERPVPEVATAPDLTEEVAEQTSRIDALIGEFEEFRNAPVAESGEPVTVDLTPITDRQAQTEATVAEVGSVLQTIEQSLASLDSRLTALENEPRTVVPDGSGAMEAQLEAFRSELDAVTAEAKAEVEAAKARASEIEAAAAEAAAKAERDAALAEVRAALESGAPFADALSAFENVPDALARPAANGVVPLANLQQSFPDAARQTLQAVESAPSDGTATSRFAAFLRKQTNARSLAPREGDDADAILSRSEAALSGGDLSAALNELDALGDDVPEDMAAWIADARARAQAVEAAAALGDATN